jgi:hypothetical protein
MIRLVLLVFCGIFQCVYTGMGCLTHDSDLFDLYRLVLLGGSYYICLGFLDGFGLVTGVPKVYEKWVGSTLSVHS